MLSKKSTAHIICPFIYAHFVCAVVQWVDLANLHNFFFFLQDGVKLLQNDNTANCSKHVHKAQLATSITLRCGTNI